MSEEHHTEPVVLHPGWVPVEPEKLPRPIYWPAGVALATVFILWALVTSYILAIVGFILLVVSVAGWLEEMRHE